MKRSIDSTSLSFNLKTPLSLKMLTPKDVYDFFKSNCFNGVVLNLSNIELTTIQSHEGLTKHVLSESAVLSINTFLSGAGAAAQVLNLKNTGVDFIDNEELIRFLTQLPDTIKIVYFG